MRKSTLLEKLLISLLIILSNEVEYPVTADYDDIINTIALASN